MAGFDRFAWPVPSRLVTASYFDPKYPDQFKKQHLGVDIHAPVGTEVVSPITGKVVRAERGSKPGYSYIMIKEDNTGYHHVLGHVSVNGIDKGVTRGKKLTTVIHFPDGGDHLHWGISRFYPKMDGETWGWGRAPVTATRIEAGQHGWLDPFLVNSVLYQV